MCLRPRAPQRARASKPPRAIAPQMLTSLFLACASPAPEGSAAPPLDSQAPEAQQPAEPDAEQPAEVDSTTGTRWVVDLDGAYFDHPSPSTLGSGMARFPNPTESPILARVLDIAAERRAASQVPVGWVRFSGPVAPPPHVMTGLDGPVLLLDVDPTSPERGRLVPCMAQALNTDAYVPENVLAMAARPGFVLAPSRDYAFVVLRSLGGEGTPLAHPPEVADLAARDPSHDAALQTLELLGLSRDQVAAYTAFRTGDAVQEEASLADAVAKEHPVEVVGLHVDPDDGLLHERFCELHGVVTLPQFQEGTPPFDQDGLFTSGVGGLPQKLRDEEAPVAITLPRTPMPPGGYPLVVYSHGSGGLSTQVVDRGRREVPKGPYEKGKGPGHVLAAYGLAAVGVAQPQNPERLEGAVSTTFINPNNLAAYRDTIRQGALEHRLALDALLRLRIPPGLVAGCVGLDEGELRFDPARVFVMGQSQGAIYANMAGGSNAGVHGVVPTGAGGLWSLQILTTDRYDGTALVGFVLGTKEARTHLHPAIHALQWAWEPVETALYMRRMAIDPLPGHPRRPVYQPVGLGDTYYDAELFDALALAYGNRQAGPVVWPSLQAALALAGLSEPVEYPVQVRESGVVVQFEGDGIADPHEVFSQLDAVKAQYGCFLGTLAATGTGIVVDPSAPCPL